MMAAKMLPLKPQSQTPGIHQSQDKNSEKLNNVNAKQSLMQDKQHVLNALKSVESSGGSNLSHVWLKNGERAIGPYAFLPRTAKELISKSPTLRTKYGNLLNIKHAPHKQQAIEDYFATHPEINDDLANEYFTQILNRTNASNAR